MSWPLVELSEVCSFENGDRGKNYPSKGSFIETGVPFINAGDLTDGGVAEDSLNFISEEHFERLSNGKVRNGDILFCLRGSLGKHALVSGLDRGAIASSLIIIRAKPNLDLSYLKHYIGSPICRREIDNYENGAAQPNLSGRDLKKFKIPLPPLEEQQRLATTLEKADNLRQKRQQAIQLADEFLRAVFLDMFGDPVANPKKWDVKLLKDLASKIGSGATPRGGKEAYQEEGISLIRSLNIHDNSFLYKDLAHINEDQADRLSNVVVESGDVLLNITGASVCRCAIVDDESLPARVNQHVCIIRPESLSSNFLLHLLISGPYKRHLLNMAGAGGATREALTKQQVESLRIPVPPAEMLKKFDAICSRLENLGARTTRFLEEPIFESLSQNAFSGEL